MTALRRTTTRETRPRAITCGGMSEAAHRARLAHRRVLKGRGRVVRPLLIAAWATMPAMRPTARPAPPNHPNSSR